MKLFPVHPVFWSSLLVLWVSQSEMEANNTDVCQEENLLNQLDQPYSSEDGYDIERTAVDDNFLCVLHPTNMLNCSWSFHTLQNETQLLVYISICDDNNRKKFSNLSEARVGSSSLILPKYENLYVIIQFNVSLHVDWAVYTYMYDLDKLEVLPPPQNVSASVKDGGLLVTWALPNTRSATSLKCFEYQLDLGDQESLKNLTNQMSHTVPNADPCRTYRVRMRARRASSCNGSPQWSEWSHSVMVEKSVSKLNTRVMISISLGIPMILLAVLLLVRHKRMYNVLFPPIPRPPPKYKCFLEKNDTSNLFRPAPSAEPEAEITEVDDTEQNLGKTF